MPKIDIQAESDTNFVVTVSADDGQTTHRVTVPGEFADRLIGEGSSQSESITELVRLSFEFLLEREPKESILREFEVTVIGRYFPEYEDDLRDRISRPS